MSKLIRAPKPPRHPLAPRLSPEQEAARLAQSKRDRRKIVAGIVLRAQPSPTPAERWRALRKARAAELAASVDPVADYAPLELRAAAAVDLAKPEASP